MNVSVATFVLRSVGLDKPQKLFLWTFPLRVGLNLESKIFTASTTTNTGYLPDSWNTTIKPASGAVVGRSYLQDLLLAAYKSLHGISL
jgi:uncharacterized membrane protein YcgQ (UPF0703/DUF1980 family)